MYYLVSLHKNIYKKSNNYYSASILIKQLFLLICIIDVFFTCNTFCVTFNYYREIKGFRVIKRLYA